MNCAPPPGLRSTPKWLTYTCVEPGCDTTLTANITAIGDRAIALVEAQPADPGAQVGARQARQLVDGARVTFAGEIVAVVVARSAAEARDAAELVDVDYEELPAALDLKEAAADAALAHPDLGTNKSAFWQFDSAAAGTGSSVEDAISEARESGILIEREYRQQRLIPAFMEPRSFVCDPTGEQLVLWTSTQIPHIVRFFLAAILGLPESKIRVIAPDVGGGFGGKLQVTPEEFILVLAARRLGKPCKYTETRSESMMACHHGRDQWQRLTLTATKDGTVTGFKADLLADLGSYAALLAGGTHAAAVVIAVDAAQSVEATGIRNGFQAIMRAMDICHRKHAQLRFGLDNRGGAIEVTTRTD